MKHEVGLRPELIAELKSKLEGLKQILASIEEEFKKKGEVDIIVRSMKYIRRKSVFFNPSKYAFEINLLVKSKAKEIVDTLYKIFPFIPYGNFYKAIENHDVIKFDEFTVPFSGHRSEYCEFFSLSSEFFKSSPYFSLTTLCEKIISNDVEAIREIQKPLYVALAYIFSSGRSFFSTDDFQELKPTVFSNSIILGINNGWIKKTEREDVYQIVEKQDLILIQCPCCNSSINAYEKYCPKCGLYLLNMITHNQKDTKEDIPKELFEEDENERKWSAYFFFDKPVESIETADLLGFPYHYKPDLLMYNVLKDAEKIGLISKVPDYISYAESYTCEFHYLSFASEYVSYYRVEGRSVQDVREKLIKVLNMIRVRVENEYESNKDSPLFKKFTRRKDNFIKEVLRICENCFTPKLDEHPIFNIKEESAVSVLRCPNCGSEMPEGAIYCGVCGNKLK